MVRLSRDLESQNWICALPTVSKHTLRTQPHQFIKVVQKMFHKSSWDQTQLHLQVFNDEISRTETHFLNARADVDEYFPSFNSLNGVRNTIEREILTRQRQMADKVDWSHEIEQLGVPPSSRSDEDPRRGGCGEKLCAITTVFPLSWRASTNRDQIDFAKKSSESRRNHRSKSEGQRDLPTPTQPVFIQNNRSRLNTHGQKGRQIPGILQGDWTF
ncbi:hypothetical protein P691DRAFT_805049 [Macrolepiota fuliginosa MF-IS2]|uniref:Uncharacterized protein n=1 Tax=Macrolepiota fuliginosa MF-IS2 TaxID=1400762 RepID=A0A9P6C1Q1_9AGAR|nr:hypothetical protein P691DRAFT_805049 [Macrolepiota fuliginosa MF-IS2]